MFESWYSFLLILFRTINQILTAGIAITAFSLLLHVLTFNLRDRVIRLFASILICVVIVFTGEAISSASRDTMQIEFWLHFEWVGIILLPGAYLNFSDALLAITGKPSRWRRIWAVRAAYLLSILFLISVVGGLFIGELVLDKQPAPHLRPNLVTTVFTAFYVACMAMSWFNFARAFQRTTTPTSRRRMGYLIFGALGPGIGSFPFLLYSSDFAGQSPLIFWIVAVFSNLLLGGLVVVMSYAVAFFGVPWPDRVVKKRMLKWILRGPVTACITLALTTIFRRLGVFLAIDTSVLLPILMALSILICEYLISLLSPYWEQWLFFGKDRSDLDLLRRLEDQLLTRSDLRQFLEMVLSTVCDTLQSQGAYIGVFNGEGVELLVSIGKTQLEDFDHLEHLRKDQESTELFRDGDDFYMPLVGVSEQGETTWYGLMGVSGIPSGELDAEQTQIVQILANRAMVALRDRKIQQESFKALQSLAPEVDMIQLMRAQVRYNGERLLQEGMLEQEEDVAMWVKEALTHYWGGPKLTESPLIKLQIVQGSLDEHDGNPANALRAILRKAIEQTKPEGERRFTADWILYNILELKFLEGRKVREVASRLAMSEADLYRKQRVAIESVTRSILEMEQQARSEEQS